MVAVPQRRQPRAGGGSGGGALLQRTPLLAPRPPLAPARHDAAAVAAALRLRIRVRISTHRRRVRRVLQRVQRVLCGPTACPWVSAADASLASAAAAALSRLRAGLPLPGSPAALAALRRLQDGAAQALLPPRRRLPPARRRPVDAARAVQREWAGRAASGLQPQLEPAGPLHGRVTGAASLRVHGGATASFDVHCLGTNGRHLKWTNTVAAYCL